MQFRPPQAFEELQHTSYGKPLRWWRYTDTLASAALRHPSGRIIVLSALHNGNCCYWHTPLPPMPLYGADLLDERPDDPALILETEASADKARDLFPEYVNITWLGGANAADNADVAKLKGRDVVLWPDNDGAGWTAMARLKARLERFGARAVAVVEMQPEWMPGWDLSRPPLPGMTPESVRPEVLRRVLKETEYARSK